MTEMPTILNRSDIYRNFPNPYEAVDDDEINKRAEARKKGKLVRVIGKYTQIDARRRQEPPPVYEGIVALMLAEDTAERAAVFLHPTCHPEAIRPAQEIAWYNDRLVVVVGRFVPDSPESPNAVAHLVGPCMLTIDSIDFWTQE
ncbi:hypothetical protein Osc7112_6907 (plasmid) [Oscillatoria nigro-viridis PCC 7112]|uniref:Uncharacterized protein n=1 Tax=Phormidium nigroviride PCC 7112 TaxID=179408 RepID=K9VSS2_9CYAN|nr:hypothetical protein [Oscillatoria nigro-viridis]AFZ10986.1 hypothetical protein Osc7112_6907 [Oscillatoria nigro-viridis PCC 7112]